MPRSGTPPTYPEKASTYPLLGEVLQMGEVASLGTDTVYALVADATNPSSIEKIYALKNREKNKPLGIFVADIPSALRYAILPPVLEKIIPRWMPGPLTLLLPARPHTLPARLTQNSPWIGVRIPPSPFLLTLLSKLPFPLVATSANPSGLAPAWTAAMVRAYFPHEQLGFLVDTGPCPIRIPSTIIAYDEKENQIQLIREGSITLQALQQAFPTLSIIHK